MPWYVPQDLVMEADVDEVSVLEPSALQNGGEMTAEMVSFYGVKLRGPSATAGATQ